MSKNTFKIKLMMSVGSILLCTSELSVASEDMFDEMVRQDIGYKLERINDELGAQSALSTLSAWVSTSNPDIQQKTLQLAEALIKKWELNPPSWFPATLPQAQATAAQIYQEVSSQMPDEPSELTEAKKELKEVIEAEVLHAKMQEKEGELPAILPEQLVDDILKQDPEAQQQVEEARHKHEAKMEVKRQAEERKQARHEVDEKLETEKRLEKEEQARRDHQAKLQIGRLLEEKKEQAGQYPHDAKKTEVQPKDVGE